MVDDGPELREDQGQGEGWKIWDILDSIRSQRHILNETAKFLETDLIGSQKTIETDLGLDGGTAEDLQTILVGRPKIRDRFEF